MNTIALEQLLPEVFVDKADLQSDIWLQDVTFEKGKTYLIEAMSGTGKSSLCSYLIGYRHDYRGTFRFDGRDIREFSVSDWVKLRQYSLSHLFQELRLFPELTAYENIEIKNNLTKFKSKQEIETWFDRLGIADKLDALVGRMSFGQQQRVALIRSLVQPFDFLLADEPISHLDDHNSQIMGEIMMEEAHRQAAGVLITSIGKHIDLTYDHIYHL